MHNITHLLRSAVQVVQLYKFGLAYFAQWLQSFESDAMR